jgi:hypothetical protein
VIQQLMLKNYSAPSIDNRIFAAPKWRRVRVVEGARLESVYTRKGIKGSNPFVSAKILR